MDYYVEETPNLAKDWCPTCEPDRDPMREILHTQYCWAHQDLVLGQADAMVPPPENPSWHHAGDAGGASNKAFCDFIRGEGWRN